MRGVGPQVGVRRVPRRRASSFAASISRVPHAGSPGRPGLGAGGDQVRRTRRMWTKSAYRSLRMSALARNVRAACAPAGHGARARRSVRPGLLEPRPLSSRSIPFHSCRRCFVSALLPEHTLAATEKGYILPQGRLRAQVQLLPTPSNVQEACTGARPTGDPTDEYCTRVGLTWQWYIQVSRNARRSVALGEDEGVIGPRYQKTAAPCALSLSLVFLRSGCGPTLRKRRAQPRQREARSTEQA